MDRKARRLRRDIPRSVLRRQDVKARPIVRANLTARRYAQDKATRKVVAKPSSAVPSDPRIYPPTGVAITQRPADVPSAPSRPIKILWLYKFIKHYDFDNWLHLKFAEAISKTQNISLLAYGPDVHLGYPSLAKLHYRADRTIQDIAREFPFDVVVLNTKSRMFHNYNPFIGMVKGEWLPHGIASFGVPKVVIEEDYHYEKGDEWYADRGVSLILQRHWSQALRQTKVPMQWLPFSVDTATFAPDSRQRHNKICFVGSTNPEAYQYRHGAISKLEAAQMIDAFPNQQRVGDAYVQCLKDYVAHLSCSSIYRLTSAKMFEIMASGSALLTNENDDLPHLFPDGSYFTYKTDLSNVQEVGRKILHDPRHREAVAIAGRDAVLQRHSHERRIAELAEILIRLKP